MKVAIKEIRMKNAKGVKDFTFTPAGRSAVISGDNKTGKTTIFDAFLWCLFDMDSSGRKGAEAIKTTDKTSYKHNLEHEVVVTLLIDGKERAYKKVLSEKWIKPQDRPEKKLTGNTNSYWIDDNPSSQAEYSEEIKKLVPESFMPIFKDATQLLKIMTDPLYFSIQMDWRDRLSVLIAMAGTPDKTDICGDDKELSDFIDMLGDLPTDKYKEKISGQINQLDIEIKKIPPVINELTSSIKGPSEATMRPLESMISKVNETIRKCELEMSNAAEANKPIIEAQRELIVLNAEKENILRKLAFDANAERNAMTDRRIQLAGVIRESEQRCNNLLSQATLEDNQITEYENKLKELRSEWSEVENARIACFKTVFDPPDLSALICDKCGQSLPENDIRERLTLAGQEFDRNKTSQLNYLISRKDQLKIRAEKIKEEIELSNKRKDGNFTEITKINMEIITLKKDLDALSIKLDSTQMYMPADFAKDQAVIDLECKIMAATITSSMSVSEQALDCYQRKQKATEELHELHQQLFTRNAEIKSQARIDELVAQERDMNNRKVSLQGMIYLCDKYIREKTRASEDKINALFTDVSFKLFKEQVNGGVDETCEAVVEETTFLKANTAAQTNAGLAIINAISNFYDLQMPVFIDRVESNLHLYEIRSQYITLEVQPHPIKVELL